MPTITFSLKDLQNLIGKKLSLDQVKEYAHYAKGGFEDYDKDSGELKVEFGDTNLPYLWSVEGFARLIKSLEGKQKGIPEIKIQKSPHKVIVDKSVSKVRPFVTAFSATGKKIDEYLLKQIIQLQEKLCDSYGRKRQKIAIGIYQLEKIKFPVHYKATSPESVKFIPLEYRKEMTQGQILEEHPKGREYAWILEGFDKYPLLIDSDDKVLSFPPIINSHTTGKIEVGDENIFFEATGTDHESLLLATNIFAYALSDRGFKISSVEITYPDKTKISTPKLSKDKIKIAPKMITDILGLKLAEKDIKRLLEKYHYSYDSGTVMIPPFRKDIMHPNDVIEDIGISYGYDNIPETPLKSYTQGGTEKITEFIDRVRELMVGQGYQEIISPVLSNKDILYDKMNSKDFGTVEIEKFMTEKFSVVRSWLIPIITDFLSKNTHVEYPQKVFEQGIVAVRKGDNVSEYERIAFATAHDKAGFTEAKQLLDYIFSALGIDYSIEETEHDSFIPGRVGRVIVNQKKVGFIGEISPVVLSKQNIEVPVAAVELNLTEIFEGVPKG